MHYGIFLGFATLQPLCNNLCVHHTRSTNDLKDKNEKPFALSYMKLMQPNGTTLKNTEHDLIVYKVLYTFIIVFEVLYRGNN